MLNSLSETQRIRLLLVNLALVGLCIVGLVGATLVYPYLYAPGLAPVPSQTNTLRPTFTPSHTTTPTLTPTLTRTPWPTQTPGVTPTFTRTTTATVTLPAPQLPTLTPARAAIRADVYNLRAWSPEQAEYAARLLHGYLPAFSANDALAYARALRFPILAWREALVRFPSAPQGIDWHWALAYDLAQNGSQRAGEEYAYVLAHALNAGETDIPRLYSWFSQREARLSLLMTAIQAPAGYLGSYVVELRGASGSAFIWLRQSANGYQATPLLTRFNIALPLQANWLVVDLNHAAQDGDEVAIYFTTPAREYWIDAPVVFNLSQPEAEALPFFPQTGIFNLGMEFTNRWIVRANQAGENELVFQSTVFPACPVRVEQAYRWSGEAFVLVDQSFTLDAQAPILPYCGAVLDHAATTWGPAAAITLMEPLLPDWPPAGADPAGDPYPPDARDEWRYRLGIYHALLGNADKARQYLNDVSTHPVMYNSRWIIPAQEFIRVYRTPADVYRACVISDACNPAEAIHRLVGGLPPEQDAFETLKTGGLNPVASGYFDFDGDGEKERWFTTRYRDRQQLVFWILPRVATGWQALRVDTVDGSPPDLNYLDEAYIAEDGLSLQPVTFLEGRLAFTMRRAPGSQAAYLAAVPLRKEYPSKFFQPLQVLEQALFSGGEPAAIQTRLENLQDYPGLLCQPTWSCDEYYYLLGLASELAGDEESAIAAYHRLWQDYTRSPYTVLARLKLEGSGPVNTAVPTVTATLPGVTPAPATPAPGVTDTPSLTPSATSLTPSATNGTATVSPTPSLSPTITETPDPNAPTATPTLSPTPGTITPTLTPTLTPSLTP